MSTVIVLPSRRSASQPVSIFAEVTGAVQFDVAIRRGTGDCFDAVIAVNNQCAEKRIVEPRDRMVALDMIVELHILGTRGRSCRVETQGDAPCRGLVAHHRSGVRRGSTKVIPAWRPPAVKSARSGMPAPDGLR
jgi:hypothetical protein